MSITTFKGVREDIRCAAREIVSEILGGASTPIGDMIAEASDSLVGVYHVHQKDAWEAIMAHDRHSEDYMRDAFKMAETYQEARAMALYIYYRIAITAHLGSDHYETARTLSEIAYLEAKEDLDPYQQDELDELYAEARDQLGDLMPE